MALPLPLVPIGLPTFLVRHAWAHPDKFGQIGVADTDDAPRDSIYVVDVNNKDVADVVMGVIEDRKVLNRLRQGSVLVLDGSSEGAGFRPDVFMRLERILREASIAESGIVCLTQNEKYAQDFANWRLGLHLPEFAYVYVYHSYLRLIMKKMRSVLDNTLERARILDSIGTLGQDGKRARFLCLNNKARAHRLVVVGTLVRRGMLKQGLVSLLCGRSDREQFQFRSAFEASLKQFPNFGEELEAIHSIQDKLPLRVSREDLSEEDSELDFSMGGPIEYYLDSSLSLVVETEMTAGKIKRFTEKLLKPLACGHPLLVAGNPATLNLVRKYGFQTFSPLIDESYDLIESPERRMELILKEFLRIVCLPEQDFADFLNRIRPILEHNILNFEQNLPHLLDEEDRWLAYRLRELLQSRRGSVHRA